MKRRKVILERDERGFVRMVPAEIRLPIEQTRPRPRPRREALTREEKWLLVVASSLIAIAIVLGMYMAHWR